MNELTAERLRELLDYDPDTGVFTWKVRASSRINVGDVAGSSDDKGYLIFRIDGRMRRAHRLAWLYVHGEWPPDQIDHINCVKNDNRIANLRPATNSENHHNLRKARADSTTGLLGVSPFRGKFMAQIRVDGKKRHLGCFPTPEEAHAAYVAAKRRLHPYGNL